MQLWNGDSPRCGESIVHHLARFVLVKPQAICAVESDSMTEKWNSESLCLPFVALALKQHVTFPSI
jgi:hypothetical protein